MTFKNEVYSLLEQPFACYILKIDNGHLCPCIKCTGNTFALVTPDAGGLIDRAQDSHGEGREFEIPTESNQYLTKFILVARYSA